MRSLTSQQIFPGQERSDTYQSEARLAEVKQNLTALAVVWPDAAVGREDSIGAGSSLRNKVVIRRLSYLDLFLMVASSSYMPKEIVAVSKQGTRGTGGDGQTSQSLLKNQGMSAEYPFPFKKLENKRKTKRSKKKTKTNYPLPVPARGVK